MYIVHCVGNHGLPISPALESSGSTVLGASNVLSREEPIALILVTEGVINNLAAGISLEFTVTLSVDTISTLYAGIAILDQEAKAVHWKVTSQVTIVSEVILAGTNTHLELS